MSCWSRSFALAMTLAVPLSAGPVETTPSTTRGEAASDALHTSPWLSGDTAKYQLHSARDIVIDTRRRTLMVFAVPAKHRKVVAMLQRIFADPTDKPAAPVVPPKVPVKPNGPSSTYKYQGEKLSTIIRDLAAEANLNLVIRGPEPTQTCDLTFKNVPTKDLLKLLLDVYNYNYQMSPNGETLVVFNGPVHRVMESYSIPPKVTAPLEEIAQALQVTILDVDEPCGPPVEEHHEPTPTDPLTVEVPAPGATGDAGTSSVDSAPAPELPDAATGGAIELSPSPVDVPPTAPASAAPAAGASAAPPAAPSATSSPANP